MNQNDQNLSQFGAMCVTGFASLFYHFSHSPFFFYNRTSGPACSTKMFKIVRWNSNGIWIYYLVLVNIRTTCIRGISLGCVWIKDLWCNLWRASRGNRKREFNVFENSICISIFSLRSANCFTNPWTRYDLSDIERKQEPLLSSDVQWSSDIWWFVFEFLI